MFFIYYTLSLCYYIHDLNLMFLLLFHECIEWFFFKEFFPTFEILLFLGLIFNYYC